jgi:uncharacterized protein (DUF2235 family)
MTEVQAVTAPRRGGKNIVVCSDGTGNRDIQGRGTNVFKLFEAVDLNGHRTNPMLPPQIALYDDGVGTQDFRPLKIFGGATGFGLSRNVRQLYREIARIYDEGDRIFLFGFSRGAFTVRTLAGFIGTCGLVDATRARSAAELEATVRRGYRIYRQRYRTWLTRKLFGPPTMRALEEFKEAWCRPGQPKIRFMGVWDTVDAVGLPFHFSEVINFAIYRFKFPDPFLGMHVEHACQAFSLDDARAEFAPVPWRPRDAADVDRIEQVWFSGSHSNVGGGYPKQGMSLVTLDWMLERATRHGLRVLRGDLDFYQEHANVDDKLYDSRAGLGIFYRWKPRDMAKICADAKMPPVLHLSALERVAHGTDDYAPGNLDPRASVMFTSTGDPDKDAAVAARARGVESTLRAADGGNGRSLLARVSRAIVIGRISYYVYLASCLAVLVAASAREGARTTPQAFLHNLGTLLYNVVTLSIGALLQTVKQLVSSPPLLVLLVSGFVLSWALDRVANSRMSREFSGFWHEHQQALREGLKSARVAAAKTLGAGPSPGQDAGASVARPPTYR